MKCCICNKRINKGEEYNFVFGTYSHKKCDSEYWEKMEKNIKTGKKSDDFAKI